MLFFFFYLKERKFEQQMDRFPDALNVFRVSVGKRKTLNVVAGARRGWSDCFPKWRPSGIFHDVASAYRVCRERTQ